MLDCFDSAIVGHVMDNNMKTPLCTAALNSAVQRYGYFQDRILHSGRGSQFASHVFWQVLEAKSCQQSMGRAGSCYGNAWMESFFATFIKKELVYRLHKRLEKGHGRISKWVVRTCDAGWFEDKDKWPLLHTFISVQRTCTCGEATSTQTALFISSLQADAATFSRLVRNHWGIENGLYCTLDVSFRVDASLLHEPNAVQNLSLLRKMALALIQSDFFPQGQFEPQR